MFRDVLNRIVSNINKVILKTLKKIVSKKKQDCLVRTRKETIDSISSAAAVLGSLLGRC